MLFNMMAMYLFHFWLALFIRNSVAADTMNVYPMDTTIFNISCDNSTIIKINETNVIDEEKNNFCTDQKCQLNKEDSVSIQDYCNGRHSCSIFSNFSSQCLYRRKLVNISYTCKAPTNLKCNFEYSDACNWKLNGTHPVDITDWIKINGRNGEEKLNDHTTEKDFGYYAIMRYKERITFANFVSELIVSKNKLCLTFWYAGKGVYFLSVFYLYNETDSPHEIHTISNPNTDNWTKTSVDINVNGSINIVIKGTLTSGQYIAIDDIDVLNGPCNDTFKTVDTFEYEGYGNWRVHKTKNLTLSTECGSDHTTDKFDGKCVAISAKEGSDGNLLLVRDLNATKFNKFCLQLWYNNAQLKENEAMIDIYLKENSKEHPLMETFVLPPTNSTQDVVWKLLSLNFHKSYPCNLFIKIRLPPSNNLRYIGIDDIMLQNSECPGTKVYTDECVYINSPITLSKCPTQYISDISINYGHTNNATTSCPYKAVKDNIIKMCASTNNVYCTFSFPLNGTTCLAIDRNLSITYTCENECENGRYDEKCSDKVCDHESGYCTVNKEEANWSIVYILSAAGGFVIILIFISVIIVMVCRKSRHTTNRTGNKDRNVNIKHSYDEKADEQFGVQLHSLSHPRQQPPNSIVPLANLDSASPSDDNTQPYMTLTVDRNDDLESYSTLSNTQPYMTLTADRNDYLEPYSTIRNFKEPE